MNLGKDEGLEEKMNRVIAILPKIQGKRVFFIWKVCLRILILLRKEKEETEITAENWNGGYDEDGNYTGDGEYDEDGNYVAYAENSSCELLRTGMVVMTKKEITPEQVNMTNPVIM